MNTKPTPLHPFDIELDVLDRMLNFEIADDPHYSGLEIQAFDDSSHGKGTVVFVSRRSDGKNDVYFESGLKLDPASYAIGNGLGLWTETEFKRNRLEVSDRGVIADVLFSDCDGRVIEVHASDSTPRGRRSVAFLAPMGAAIASPESLPLVWMSEFDLLRRSGPDPVVRIDGREARLGRLPVEWMTRRRLVKVAADLCILSLNPNRSEIPLDQMAPAVETTETENGTSVISGRVDQHEARVEFDPPFPDLRKAPPTQRGRWTISIDTKRVVGGIWRIARDKETKIVLEVTQGWKPTGLPILMRVVTRVAAVFRTWPTTYRWEATISEDLVMTSAWKRTEAERGESYRQLTGSA